MLASQLDHGELQGLSDDDHAQYALLVGRATGQTLVGGTAAAEVLGLRGSADADLGFIEYASEFRDSADMLPTLAGNYTVLEFRPASHNAAGGIVGQTGIDIAPTVTVDTTALIYSVFRGSGVFTNSALPNPTFSAWILFLGNPRLTSDDITFHALNSIMLSANPQYFTDGLGNLIATPFTVGVMYSPLLEALQAADTTTLTDIKALVVKPEWHTTNATATVDFGDIKGVHCRDLGPRLFGSSLGTEQYTSYRGLSFDNLVALAPSGLNVVIHSDLVAAATNLFLNNVGGADSLFGTGGISGLGFLSIGADDAGGGLKLGASQDIEIYWDAGNFLVLNPASGNAINFNWSVTQETLSIDQNGETGLRLLFEHFSFSGLVPDPDASATTFFAIFAPGARSPNAAGEYRDIFFADTAALDINGLAMTTVDSWQINRHFNPVLSAGSIDDHSVLHLQQSQALGTRNQTLWVDRGRARFDGILNFGEEDITQLTLPTTSNLVIGTGDNARAVLRLSSDAARNLTGIVIEQGNDSLYLVNVGSFTISLVHNATSTATNRFSMPGAANFLLTAGEAIQIWHDPTTDRWRKVS